MFLIFLETFQRKVSLKNLEKRNVVFYIFCFNPYLECAIKLFLETPQLCNSVSAKTLLYMGANTEFLALDAPS